MNDNPTFTFGNNQSRDKASHLKSVMSELNERKLK